MIQLDKVSVQSLEGYLSRKKLGVWKKKYFTIKNEKLYWGKDDTTRKAKNSTEIRTIKKCEALRERELILVRYLISVYKERVFYVSFSLCLINSRNWRKKCSN